MAKITIPFDPQITGEAILRSGEHGVLLAHGEKSHIDDGILPALAKKLGEMQISSIRFNFPFRENKQNQLDDLNTLDQSYLAVWNYVTENYPNIKWCVGGHGAGAESAIRVSGLIMDDVGIPPVISISFPMYPPNRPELVNTYNLGALMGDGLFCQGEKSNRGTFDRLRNQIRMMAPHAHLSRIGGADHFMEVKNKPITTVAYWIANDIRKFFKDI